MKRERERKPTSNKKRADQVEVLDSKYQSAQLNRHLNPSHISDSDSVSEPVQSRSRGVCADLSAPCSSITCNSSSIASRPLASLASNESKVINVCDTATITIQCAIAIAIAAAIASAKASAPCPLRGCV